MLFCGKLTFLLFSSGNECSTFSAKAVSILLLKPVDIFLFLCYWYMDSFSLTTLAVPERRHPCLSFPKPIYMTTKRPTILDFECGKGSGNQVVLLPNLRHVLSCVFHVACVLVANQRKSWVDDVSVISTSLHVVCLADEVARSWILKAQIKTCESFLEQLDKVMNLFECKFQFNTMCCWAHWLTTLLSLTTNEIRNVCASCKLIYIFCARIEGRHANFTVCHCFRAWFSSLNR